jgi:Rrf2 family iron-sulfur cluster assembly transcriptional regulator
VPDAQQAFTSCSLPAVGSRTVCGFGVSSREGCYDPGWPTPSTDSAMKISTRARYSVRALIELARCYGEGPLSSKAISRSQQIPSRYLQRLLAKLRHARLVRVAMGPGGGFELAVPPSKVRISDIMDAVNERLELVHCVARPAGCTRAPDCSAHAMWRGATEILHRHFHSLTLADVLPERDGSEPRAPSRRVRAHPRR